MFQCLAPSKSLQCQAWPAAVFEKDWYFRLHEELRPCSLLTNMTMSSRRRACIGGCRRQTIHIPSLLGLAVLWTSSYSTSFLADAFAFAFATRNFGRQPGRRRRANIPRQQQQQQGRGPTFLLLTSKNENESSDETNNDNSAEDDKMLSELVRVKLEADHTRKFLKSRPRKLKYDEARTWVQRNLGVDTEDEFNDLVENGNLRTPYIPKRPEEYYTQSKEWISWDHFLKDDPDYPGVKPASGAFD